MAHKNIVRLPAVDIEIPRMGLIVYVHPDLYIGKKKISVQFSAVVTEFGQAELQTFKYECKTLGEATTTQKVFEKRLAGGGPFMFIQHTA